MFLIKKIDSLNKAHKRWCIIMQLSKDDLLKCINKSVDGIMISDHRGVILYVNEQYIALTKLSKDIIGHNMQEYVEAKVVEQSTCLSAIKHNRVYTRIHHELNDVEIISVSKPVYNKRKEIEYVITNVRDISTYINIEKNLKQTDRKFGELFDAIKENKQELVVSSPEMINIMHLAKKVSKVDTSILLLGETGVGKDVFAEFIHKNSMRKDERFIALNCGAIPNELMESELFGYEAGSFTGGLKEGKQGILYHANKGTLFLDEIGDLPYHLQVKLLRVLEKRKYSPIGSVKEIPVDIRVIAATNKNIQEQIRNNKFREDLYYRLSVLTLLIPPLRKRQGDIIPLAVYFLKKYNSKYGVSKKFDTDTLIQLQRYHWPGNVRELKNIIEKMVILSQGDILDFQLAFAHEEITEEQLSLKSFLGKKEKEYLINMKKVYKTTREVANAIGVDHSTVVRKYKKYGIS